MAVYVMSDIHGLKQRFDNVLKKIAFDAEDTLYILGDVIDRGKDGIELLQEIRKHNNIHLLMGNHEHMMVEYYDAKAQIEHDREDYDAYERIDRWNYNHNRPTKKAFEGLPEEEQAGLLTYLRQLPRALPDIVVKHRHFYLVHACPRTQESDTCMD